MGRGDRRAGHDRAWWLDRLAGVLGALVVAMWILVVVWALRLGEPLMVVWALTSLLGTVLVAAWFIAVAAALMRRWVLLAASVGLVLVQVVVLAPRFQGHHRADAAGGVTTIGSVNAFVDNRQLPEMAREIAKGPPDVLVVEEFTVDAQFALRRAGVEAHYPHRILRPGDTTGMAVYSRAPIHLASTPRAPRDELAVDLSLPGRTVRLVGVHVFPPQPGDPGSWRRDLASLDRYLGRLDGPWIAIGDFNATFDHRPFRDLLGGGRRDAHLETGRAWARTWPSSSRVPPLLLIDHALVSPSIGVVATRERTVAGTDHRMIEVDVRRR